MERIFALYDSDSFYATRFMEYFKKKKEFNFEFSAFTRKDSLEEFLNKHPIEILLLGSQDLEEETFFHKVKYIYKLTDSQGEENNPGYQSVYKYQPAQALMKEIMNDYNRRENALPITNHSKPARMISIYSPIQSAEIITFAWSVGTLLADHQKVLLVMLDPIPVQLVAFADSSNPSLTEFIFYLKENVNSIMKMKSLLGYAGNLSYLIGITHAADILSLNKEDIRKWVDEIKIHTDYDTVIFYLGTHSDATDELMKLSDKVLVTNMGSAYEDAIYSVWSTQMEYSGFNMNNDKFNRIRLPREEELGQAQIPITELKNTLSWNNSKQCIQIFS